LEKRTANATARKAGNAVHETNLLLLDGCGFGFTVVAGFGGTFVVAGGTFVVAGFGGTFVVAGGTFVVAGGTFVVAGGTFVVAGGTFVVAGGTFVVTVGPSPRATTARTKTTSAILFHIFINFLSTRNSTN